MTPCQGNTFLFYSSQQLPPLCISDFLADTVTSKGPLFALCITSRTTEKQWNHQVCGARQGGQRTPSRITDTNLDCMFGENALVFVVPKWGAGGLGPACPIWVTIPVLSQPEHVCSWRRRQRRGRAGIQFSLLWRRGSREKRVCQVVQHTAQGSTLSTLGTTTLLRNV